MNIQHRINQQRVNHIVDSYLLAGEDPASFQKYLDDLIVQYPAGLIELALVETLVSNWLKIPMEKGVAFLAATHERLKQWQQPDQSPAITPSQFSQIVGLDAQPAFTALEHYRVLPTQAATD